jgi:Ala-tRNA(Pro) deacylase
MSMTERLKAFLGASHARYEVRAHPDAFSAQKVAAESHVPGREMAKVVVVRDRSDRTYMVVLPAPERLDFSALSWVIGAEGLRLARESEMKELFPDCEPGAMPPFGHLYGMPVYVDDGFATRKAIYFEDGTHHELVGMRFPEFVRLEKPVIAHLSRGVARA